MRAREHEVAELGHEQGHLDVAAAVGQGRVDVEREAVDLDVARPRALALGQSACGRLLASLAGLGLTGLTGRAKP